MQKKTSRFLSRHLVVLMVAATSAAAGVTGAARALAEGGSSAGATASHPNVLLIMTDDQGWGDVHAHGNRHLNTPVLDGLHRTGARFERFYVSPVCAPTRASLLTGRYHLRTGTHGVTRGRENMRAEETTIAEVFQAAGYKTGCFGKWHNGAHYPMDPNGQGFDEFLGFCAGHWNNYFDTTLQHNGEMVRTEGYITDVLTDAAISFIEKNSDRPFFCYMPYNAPHSPWQVPDRYWNKYKDRDLDPKAACAYAMVENIDDNVGRLLGHLQRLGLAENTIVLFTTDNGPNSNRYNGDMRGRKGSAHEGGVRVPLFVRWPGRIEPQAIEPIAMHIDILPTLAELCGVPVAESPDRPLDGRSLAPLLLGEPAARAWPERRLFTHKYRGGSNAAAMAGAVRTPRWRCVRDRRGQPWKLFDMRADPGETKDIAGDHPQVAAELAAAFEKSAADVTRRGFEVIPVPVGHPERPRVTLPGHEAFLEPGYGEGIRYQGRSGWANDYITGWTSTDAFPRWEIDVVRPGDYEVPRMYRCGEPSVGTRLRVSVGEAQVEGHVARPHDPPRVASPDRIPRKEVYEFDWAPLEMGTLTLPAGPAQLRVLAAEPAGEEIIDLKAVVLRRKE